MAHEHEVRGFETPLPLASRIWLGFVATLEGRHGLLLQVLLRIAFLLVLPTAYLLLSLLGATNTPR